MAGAKAVKNMNELVSHVKPGCLKFIWQAIIGPESFEAEKKYDQT